MAEVDASIYKVAPPPNPLDTAAKFYDINNAALNSKLLGQQVQGNQGYANALTGAVDPTTGQFDPAKAAAAASGAGVRAGDVIHDANAIQGTQQDLAIKQATDVYNGFGAILQTNPNPTHDDLVKLATDYLSQPRRLTKATYDRIISEIPTDPAAVRAYVQSRFIATLPQGGGVPGAALGPDQNLAPTTGTSGQAFVKATGGAPATSAGATGAASVPGAPQTAPAAPPAKTASGFVSGAPPGAEEAQTASAKLFASDRNAATDYARTVGPLTLAIPLLESLGTAGGGPGADVANEMNSFFQTLHAQMPWLPLPPTLNVDPKTNKVANYDEAQKWLTQNAGNIGAGLGTGSQDYLAAAISGNPNMKMSNLAAQDAAKAMLGFARMGQAKVLEFQRLHPNATADAGQYADWATGWSKDQDPRAYTLDVLTPEARTKLLVGYTDPKTGKVVDPIIKPGTKEAEKFAKSYDAAIANGLISQTWENAGGK